MKLIHCVLPITLAGFLCSSLLPITANAACVGGSCTSSGGGGGTSSGAGGSGGSHRGHGGHGGGYGGGSGTDLAIGLAGVAAAIAIDAARRDAEAQKNVKSSEGTKRRVKSVRARSDNNAGEDIGDAVGDGTKVMINEKSSQDPPLNQFAQLPTDINDSGVVLDAGTGSGQPVIGSVGSARETTGSAAQGTAASVGSSDSTTNPHVPYEKPQDYDSTTGKAIKWVVRKGVKKAVTAGVLAAGGAVPVVIYEVGSNASKVIKAVEEGNKKFEAEQAEHDKIAKEITAIRDANLEQAQEQMRDLR
jgi:hypothetical protein